MASRLSTPGRRFAAVVSAVALGVLSVGPAASAAPDGGGPVLVPAEDGGGPVDAGAGACVAVRSEARYVPYGYTHVVVLTSACPRDATCTVSTDVNPEKQTVVVPKGATVEVITFVASPSQTFRPQVDCRLR